MLRTKHALGEWANIVQHPLTKLDFGDNVRDADIRAGEEARQVEAIEDIPLSRSTRRRKSPVRRKRR